MFRYYSTQRNVMNFYLKGLFLKPNTAYRFSADIYGGTVNVYMSARGVPRGNQSHITEPTDRWEHLSFDFVTGDSKNELAGFVDWGISFLKEEPSGSADEDTYIDNVSLIEIEDPEVEIIEGGNFEPSRHSNAYDKNWKPEILGPSGRARGINIVTDPLCENNRCLLLPRLTTAASTQTSLLHVKKISWFKDNQRDIPCASRVADTAHLFLLVERGHILFETDEKTIDITAGTLLHCPPHTQAKYTLCHGNTTAYYRLEIDGEAADSVLSTLSIPTLTACPVADIIALTMYIDQMSQIAPSLQTGTMAIDGLLMQWFSALEVQLHHAQRSTKYQEEIDKVASLLRESPETPFSNDKLADSCGLSKTHFINLFRAHTGITPKQYRLRHLIHRSCSLLTETEMTVQEIGYTLGIDDPQYFSRLFRSIRGISPRDYRKQNK